ncbi:MAG: PAS domain-containing protein [Hyphomicrobiales bacterium]|jgi:hypothetical protein
METSASGHTAEGTAPREVLHPQSRALFRYWERVRGERNAPNRGDIDLKEIRDIVRWLCILERDPVRQSYRWRLAGTGVCRIFGRELTGEPVFRGWDRFEQQMLSGMLDQVVGTLQPSVSRIRAITMSGEQLGLELIALPMCPERGPVPHVFGAIVPFREPEWLGSDPLRSFTLSAVKVIWTEPLPGLDQPMKPQWSRSARGRTILPFQVIDGGLA